ncbi:MAG TPA: DUF3106 domain-containing protein, partial [Myxococcota bacterium]|nr:DUF3106 domain-containing protein [Myxococcota bacterium]
MSTRLQRGLCRALLLGCLLFAGTYAGPARSAKAGPPPKPHPHALTPAERRHAVERWQKATPQEREQLRQRYGEGWRSLPPDEKARLREELRKEGNPSPGASGRPPAVAPGHPPAAGPGSPLVEKPALREPARPMTPERREAIRQRVANLSPE